LNKKWFLSFPILIAFALTCAITFLYGKSIGVDIIYHVDVAKQYASGNFSEVLNLNLNMNGSGIYPFFLHLLLVPSVWLGVPYQFTGLLQIIFLPLAVASFGYLVYKTYGVEASLLGMMIVLGSWAYVDRVLAVQPQSIDFILLPMGYYFLLKAKQNKLLTTCVVGFYNHGLLNLAMFAGVLLTKLKQKRWITKYILLISSLLIVTLYYLLTNTTGSTQFGVDQGFWHDPYYLITYVRLPTLGFIATIPLLYSVIKKRQINPLTKLALLSLASSSFLILFAADRYMQYATIPLTLLLVDSYLRIKDKLIRAWLFMGTLGFMMLLYAVLWFLTVNNTWQI
jgi:energy-converting hydrogenase Eha subunit C